MMVERTRATEERRADRQIARVLERTWPDFFERFGRLTAVQRAAIPPILDGRDVLVCAATASGKTEAACAPLIENFIGRSAPWTILYISPTRALVNDLYARLAAPLARLNLRIERRTGDHHYHHRKMETAPHVLLTTPESFDSLLCRGRGEYGRHILESVAAIVLDEVHLLYGTARGEQVRWLLERQRRLPRPHENGARRFQIVALSATLPDPERVRQAFLPAGQIITVAGGREIEAVAPDSATASVEDALPAYLRSVSGKEKILVFANSRLRVDELAATLRTVVAPLGYHVRAHHGSLDRREREQAEADMREREGIITVATSTLEIGVDIGDIDLIVLDGPPPNVSALLQRIGRGNRRTDVTRVLACAPTALDSLIQAAMIEAAREGWLGPVERGPQHAVARQQIASTIFGGARIATPRNELQSLLNACGGSLVADTLIPALLASDELHEDTNGVRLGAHWLEQTSRGEIHTNIEAPQGMAVMNEETGAVIARGVMSHDGHGMRVGGQLLQIRRWDAFQIEVRHVSSEALAHGDWCYTRKAFMQGSGQAQVVRRYLGFDQGTWPVIHADTATYVFHFGGARRQAVLDLAARGAPSHDGLKITPWYVRFAPRAGPPPWLLAATPAQLELRIVERLSFLERILARPYANRALPTALRVDEVRGWLNIEAELHEILSAQWRAGLSEEVKKVLQGFVNVGEMNG